VKEVQDKARWLGACVGLAAMAALFTGCSLFNTLPVADFTASALSGQAPFTVNFSAILSHDPDGIIKTYEWDFGDGTSGTGQAVSHTYTTAGTATVVLRVTDNAGAQDTEQKLIAVLPGEPPGPAAAFTASPSSGNSPLNVQFDASGSTYGTGPLSYSWTFGDGANGFGVTASHLYVSSTARTYTVTLTVRGPDGREGTMTGTITLSGPGGGGGTPGGTSPSARFTADPTDGIARLTVDFDPSDSKAASGRVLTTYTWSFGDLGTLTTNNPEIVTHIYTTTKESETFTATLIVIDDQGHVASTTRTIRVKNRQPIAGFEVSEDGATYVADDLTVHNVGPAGDVDVAIWFRSLAPIWPGGMTLPNQGSTRPTNYISADRNLSYDPEGYQFASDWGIGTYTWTWGDGSAPESDAAGAGGGWTGNHVYTLAADEQQHTFTVQLQVVDLLGGRSTVWSRQVTLTRAP